MKAILYKIVIENFKTYAGTVTIGPLKSFMSIIGPNGTGKSNLLDAVSYALGESLSNLRVKHASDLIHGAHTDRPASQKASVSVTFRFENGSMAMFTRTVSKSVHHYYVNRERTSRDDYLTELNALGLNVKAKNFFVYQGMVESIALMDPKQRTSLFEEISGSNTFKIRYDELKNKMAQAEELVQSTYLKQRSYRNDREEAKLERKEALMHEQLIDELDSNYLELQLFKLYYIQENFNNLTKEHSKNVEQLKKMNAEKVSAQRKLAKGEETLVKKMSELSKLESKIQAKDAKVKEMQLPLIKYKQEIMHAHQKLDTAKASLKKAQEVQQKHLDSVEVLKAELLAVKRERSEYEKTIAEESFSQGRDIVLEESQAKDYNELKREAARLSVSCQQQIESLLREQKTLEDRLNYNRQKYSDVEERLKRKCQQKESESKRCEKLSDCIVSKEKILKDNEMNQNSALTRQENINSVQKELENISIQLRDAKIHKHEQSRREKKLQAVESLKQRFPGVYDRLINLCEPIHKKFTIAITKVMGKYVDAIIVDKESTARLCIKHLKEKLMEPETFLPLDYLEVKPLKEHLREIKLENPTYLLYDTLHYNPPGIKQAVLFVTKSVVVCQRPEDAMQVAYNNNDGKQYDAVSLDGSYFQKSGLISGGTADLARKAKHWDEKLVLQMQAQKEELSVKLRGFIRESHNQWSDSDGAKELLEKCLRNMKKDLETSLTNICIIDKDLDKFKKILQMRKPEISEIETELKKVTSNLKKVESKLHTIEDQVFAEFCLRIGVPNIRAYEEVGLRSYEDREKKFMEFETRENRIINQLDYEGTVDTESNIRRWTDEVQQRKNVIASSKEIEQDHLVAIEDALHNLGELKEVVATKKAEIDDMGEKVDSLKENAKALNDSNHTMDKQINSLGIQISNLNRTRRSILIHCSVEGIELPILEGNLDSLVPGRTDASSESSSTTGTEIDSQATSSEIVIDFDKLARNLRNMKEATTIKEYENTLEENIAKIKTKLRSVNLPNKKVQERFEETTGKLRETTVEFDTIRKEAKRVKDMFEKVKKERCDRFNECLDFVSNEIDVIYKQMTKSTSAIALLTAENQEEPYLSGISYCCIAPGKACKPMHSLSGGEKTVASIALLVALHQFRSAPCLILDEIDAALDNTNIAKIAEFFSNNKDKFQTIAISLRSEFYCHADALVGITRDNEIGPTSVAFLLDLEAYPK